jgi:hypothetical protein
MKRDLPRWNVPTTPSAPSSLVSLPRKALIMTQSIPLLRGQTTLVDDDVYPELAQYRWRLNSSGYAVRSCKAHDKEIAVCMHREIMHAPRGLVVDHIDGNKLNCTRANMRLITQQENLMNRRCFKNNRCGYKGVTQQHGKWHARIQFHEKLIHLGFWEDQITAALAYDCAAHKLFGEYAHPNLPDSPIPPQVEQVVGAKLSAWFAAVMKSSLLFAQLAPM